MAKHITPRVRKKLPSICLTMFACLIGLSGLTTSCQTSTSFEALSRKAQAAKDRGDDVAGIRYYKQALAVKPDWQEGWWYYGSLLYDQSQYPQAIVALQKLVALNPKLGGAWALLGLSKFEEGDYDGALGDLQQANSMGVGEDPSMNNIVDYHLAILLNAHDECDAARMLLSSLFIRGVRSEDLEIALGLSLLRVPILPSQLDPSKDALVHDAGNTAAFIAMKQYSRAQESFRDLLEKYPGTSFLHYAYGAMLASMGQEDAAEEQFRLETQVNPNSAVPYVEWAFLESKAERYPQAVQLAQKAVELSSNSFMAQYVLGNALLAAGDAKTSVPHLVIASHLAPESPEVRYSLARAYAKLGEKALARQEQEEFVTLSQKKAAQKNVNGQGSVGTTTQEETGLQPSVTPN